MPAATATNDTVPAGLITRCSALVAATATLTSAAKAASPTSRQTRMTFARTTARMEFTRRPTLRVVQQSGPLRIWSVLIGLMPPALSITGRRHPRIVSSSSNALSISFDLQGRRCRG